MRLLVIGVAVSMLAGCVLATSKESFVQTQLTRAAFDLNCPADKVEVTELAPGAYSSVMGVTGCGNKATYKYVQRVGWVVQTTSAP